MGAREVRERREREAEPAGNESRNRRDLPNVVGHKSDTLAVGPSILHRAARRMFDGARLFQLPSRSNPKKHFSLVLCARGA